MTCRRAFSLLETLLAAVILALVVAFCLPLLTGSHRQVPLRTDPGLERYIRTRTEISPPNLIIERSASNIAGEIEGTWIIVRASDRIALGWIPAHPPTPGSVP